MSQAADQPDRKDKLDAALEAGFSEDAAVLHKEYARAREEFREVLLEVVASQRRGSPAEVERECDGLLDLLL